jgi:hypothetical protein
LLWHRIQFGFTITYHYLFPQLTMGLALLIVVLKVLALRTANERYNEAARFWARIFGLNFAMGVVTGTRRLSHGPPSDREPVRLGKVALPDVGRVDEVLHRL